MNCTPKWGSSGTIAMEFCEETHEPSWMIIPIVLDSTTPLQASATRGIEHCSHQRIGWMETLQKPSPSCPKNTGSPAFFPKTNAEKHGTVISKRVDFTIENGIVMNEDYIGICDFPQRLGAWTSRGSTILTKGCYPVMFVSFFIPIQLYSQIQ